MQTKLTPFLLLIIAFVINGFSQSEKEINKREKKLLATVNNIAYKVLITDLEKGNWKIGTNTNNKTLDVNEDEGTAYFKIDANTSRLNLMFMK